MQNGNLINSDSTYECVEPPEEPYQSNNADAPPLPPPLPSWNHHAAGANHRLQRNNYRNSDDSLDDVANFDEIIGKILSALGVGDFQEKNYFLHEFFNDLFNV